MIHLGRWNTFYLLNGVLSMTTIALGLKFNQTIRKMQHTRVVLLHLLIWLDTIVKICLSNDSLVHSWNIIYYDTKK